jgi:hypothetical protein
MFHGESNPLLITVNKEKAEKEMEATRKRYIENHAGNPNIWIDEIDLAEDADTFYDYDWYSESDASFDNEDDDI